MSVTVYFKNGGHATVPTAKKARVKETRAGQTSVTKPTYALACEDGEGEQVGAFPWEYVARWSVEPPAE